MNRQVLMLAFHFPPFAQSTGGQRVLGFVRHLPSLGWSPIVLTARERIYGEVDPRSLESIPHQLEIVRAWGLDVARDLAVRGRYPSWLALPDRWTTWAIGACIAGLRLIRARSPEVLWATFPIPSALVAGVLLHRLTGIPFVADLRDPVLYDQWPADPRLRRIHASIERLVVQHASAVVVTTPGALRLYHERYPRLPHSRFRVIENGIEDMTFNTDLEHDAGPIARERLTLVHSGLMEIPDRDPRAFLEAIVAMRGRGEIDSSILRVVLRATGRDAEFRRWVDDLAIGDIVTVAPRLSRAEAIAEMRQATGLLLFQGEPCNRQIPAKAYEYLASRRPIVGLCHPAGDTYDLLARQWGVPYMADMAERRQIEAILGKFIRDARAGAAYIPPQELVARHSRLVAARELAGLLAEAASKADSLGQGAPRP